MAKHIYDKDGEYKGKILSDEEHSKKQRYEMSDKESYARMLIYMFIFSAIILVCLPFNPDLVIDWVVSFSPWLILVLISLIVFIAGIIYYSKVGWKNFLIISSNNSIY